MDIQDIIKNMGEKLVIIDVIKLSRVNRICYKTCIPLLTNNIKYVNGLVQSKSSTVFGNLDPKINVDLLFSGGIKISKKLFIKVTSGFSNCIKLKFTNIHIIMKIFKNKKFQLSGVKNKQCVNIVNKNLKKLFKVDCIPITSYNYSCIRAPFVSTISTKIDVDILIACIRAILHNTLTKLIREKHKIIFNINDSITSVILYPVDKECKCFIMCKSFKILRELHNTLKLIFNMCDINKNLYLACKHNDAPLIKELLNKNCATTFLKHNLNNALTYFKNDRSYNKTSYYNYCAKGLLKYIYATNNNNIYDNIIIDKRINKFNNKNNIFVIKNIIFRLWMIKQYYINIFNFDICNIISEFYYIVF